MQPDKLVMMANQIAQYFAPQGEAKAVPQIAQHLVEFWDPRMRREIAAVAKRADSGLHPMARAAVEQLATPAVATG